MRGSNYIPISYKVPNAFSTIQALNKKKPSFKVIVTTAPLRIYMEYKHDQHLTFGQRPFLILHLEENVNHPILLAKVGLQKKWSSKRARFLQTRTTGGVLESFSFKVSKPGEWG